MNTAPGNVVPRAEPSHLPPPVVVHDLHGACSALAAGTPVTLLSAEGAALFAGCLWWVELIQAARAAYPKTPMVDVLDCADGADQAMAALRCGLARLVLWPTAPGWCAVAELAQGMGGFVLPRRPDVRDASEAHPTRRR